MTDCVKGKNYTPNQCICYHGTTKKNAKSIMKNGFKKGTYFAKHLEDSVAFGGEYVFRVRFLKMKLPDYWEFIVREPIPKEEIVELARYRKKQLYYNSTVNSEVFESNIKDEN